MRDTTIYWLIDTRPETIAEGWPNGRPFYCGYTIDTPVRKLTMLQSNARTEPASKRQVILRVRECGEHVAIHVVEIVPWSTPISKVERWTKILYAHFPKFVTAKTKKRMSKAKPRKPRKYSRRWFAEIRAANVLARRKKLNLDKNRCSGIPSVPLLCSTVTH